MYHTQYGGKKYDPYVFNGLYYSVAKLSNDLNYNRAKVPGTLRNKMFALAVSRTNSTFYTTGNDGRIFMGDYVKLTADNLVDLTILETYINGQRVAKNGKSLITAEKATIVNNFNCKKITEKEKEIGGRN